MKVMIFGLGSIGKRHAKLLLKHFNFELFAFRTTKGKGIEGVKNIRAWKDVNKIKPDVAMICNPTDKHIATALKCVEKGMHLFIEKPIGVGTRDLNVLIKKVREAKLKSYIAYPFRFNSDINSWVGKMTGLNRDATIVHETDITKWGGTYSKKAITGGGAILELSHEIDIAEFLFGPIVKIDAECEGYGHKFTDAETKARLVTTHQDGMMCSIYLSLVKKGKPRRFICFDSSAKNM